MAAAVIMVMMAAVMAWAFARWNRETAKRRAEREEAYRIAGLDRIDQMSGIEFEKYVASVLRGSGYEVRLTKVTGDFGVDLIAAKDGVRTAVQCKRKAGPVGGSAVQEVVAGAIMHQCSRTMVVSNKTFTRGATQLAHMHRCQLIDRRELERLALTNPLSVVQPAARPNPEKSAKVRCRKCQHLQEVPRSLTTFVCEQCNAKLKRRTAPAEAPATPPKATPKAPAPKGEATPEAPAQGKAPTPVLPPWPADWPVQPGNATRVRWQMHAPRNQAGKGVPQFACLGGVQYACLPTGQDNNYVAVQAPQRGGAAKVLPPVAGHPANGFANAYWGVKAANDARAAAWVAANGD